MKKHFFTLVVILLFTVISHTKLHAQCTPAGDPTVFGDHVWNQYVWNSTNWTDNYAGYDVLAMDYPNVIWFQSYALWSNLGSPSSSGSYQGCAVGPDNFSWSIKRRGFPNNKYKIDMNWHDDDAELYINGILVWSQAGASYYLGDVWSGCLNDTSTVELRMKEFTGTAVSLMSLWTQYTLLTTNGPASICPGFSETLTAAGGASSYLWNTGETTQSIIVNTAGTYSVIINAGGCVLPASTTLAVAPLTTPAITVFGNNPYPPCGSVPQVGVANYISGYTYHWNTGVTGNVIAPSGPGIYSTYATDALGCVSDTSVPLQLDAAASLPGDTTIFGDHQWNVYVHQDEGIFYDHYYNYYGLALEYDYKGLFIDTSLSFNSENHFDDLYQSPSNAPSYDGCYTYPDLFHLNAKRKGFDCGVYQVDITGHDDEGYLYINDVLVWSHIGCCDSHTNVWTGVLNEDSKIEFKLVEYDGSGHGAVKLTRVQSFTPDTATITGPTEVCLAEPISLDAGAGYSSYEWSTGSNLQTTSVNAAGNYSVKVTDTNGCVSTSQTSIGTATSFTYYYDGDGDNYGMESSAIEICTAAPLGYVSDKTDCDDANNAVNPGSPDICNTIDDNCDGITDENAISASISPAGIVSVCKGSDFLLTANSGNGLSYQWMKGKKAIAGATNQTYAPAKTASYTVIETNAYDCSSTSTAASVTLVNNPVATITPLGSLNICGTNSVVLQANGGLGYTYLWKKGSNNIDGATNQNYTATAKGSYKVIITNNNNCSDTSALVKVTKNCKDGSKGFEDSETFITLVPNPSSGIFTMALQLPDTDESKVIIQVYNAIGQLVHQAAATPVNGVVREELHLSNDARSGMYLISVIAGDTLYREQILIQK